MTSTQLPALSLDPKDLRISLFSHLAPDLERPPSLQAHAAPADAGRDTEDERRHYEDDHLQRANSRDDADDEQHLQPPPLRMSIAQEVNDFEDDGQDSPIEPIIPTHPIPLMQQAFEESLDEVTQGLTETKPRLRDSDVAGRRQKLLAQQREDRPWDSPWRYRNGQTQHESVKLISQISFGVSLLLKGMANDNNQVINILQGHIDEVDEFLEITLEDLNEAQKDMEQRVYHLEIPLGNTATFETLLQDRGYRAEILDGNEKIEHMVARMELASKMWEDDVECGVKGSAAFAEWLEKQKTAPWTVERPELEDVYYAMMGNGEGWLLAFEELNTRVHAVNDLMVSLTNTVTEVERMVGEVSRKTASTVQPYSSPTGSMHSARLSSLHSNFRTSQSHSTPRASIRSGAGSSLPPFRIESLVEEEYDDGAKDAGLYELPLSGSPFSSTTRSSARMTGSMNTPQLRVDTVSSSAPSSQHEEEPLYILQPKTYTPTTPTTQAPTPALRASPSMPALDNRTSSRQRVSIKGPSPEAIQIPPPRRSGVSTEFSPTWSSSSRTSHSYNRSSGHGSDAGSHRKPTRMVSYGDMSQPVRPPLRPAPNSDYQYMRSFDVPPHSPLQQRPHTAMPAADGMRFRQSSYTPQNHTRNQPSRIGGMSTLSTVENADHYPRPFTPGDGHGMMQAGQKGLKKKKSAFGWFKKAFTMDDEERAAFESRKQMTVETKYYSTQGQKFLDGKRLR